MGFLSWTSEETWRASTAITYSCRKRSMLEKNTDFSDYVNYAHENKTYLKVPALAKLNLWKFKTFKIVIGKKKMKKQQQRQNKPNPSNIFLDTTQSSFRYIQHYFFSSGTFIKLHPHRLFGPSQGPKLSKILMVLHFQKISYGRASTDLCLFCKEK